MLKFEIDPEMLKLQTPEGQSQYPALLREVGEFARHPGVEPLLADVKPGQCVRVTIEVTDWSPENAEMNALLDAPLA